MPMSPPRRGDAEKNQNLTQFSALSASSALSKSRGRPPVLAHQVVLFCSFWFYSASPRLCGGGSIRYPEKAVPFNPSSMSRVCVRATNWLGDAVMSLPAIRTIRQVFPSAHIAIVARPWVADLYAREPAIDRVIPYTAQSGLRAKREFAARLRAERFDG